MAMCWCTCSIRTRANTTAWRISGPTHRGSTGSAGKMLRRWFQFLRRLFSRRACSARTASLQTVSSFCNDPARAEHARRLNNSPDACMTPLSQIQTKIRGALHGVVADVEPYAAMVKPTQDAKHGDYQANCAMSLAKTLGKKPRDVAQEIVARLDLGDLLQTPE